MKSDYSFLPANKQAELKAIIGTLIPRYAEIEMIILFGSYARNEHVDHTYMENGNTYTYKSDFDLLVILSKNGQANADTFTQSVMGRLHELNLETPVHPIFHGIDFVNTELSEGNYFFDDIKKEGILLFNTTRYQLAEKRDLSPAEMQAKAQRDFDHWFRSANSFLIDYKHGFDRQDYNKAAFELHQATERYYGAIQLVFTGYKPKTHDLEILGNLAKSQSIEFGKVFPQATPQERQRFTLLKKAYVDARYKMDYKITPEDLSYLSDRVHILRALTEQICKEKIASFTQ